MTHATKGDRVRMVGVMRDDPAPMEVGAEGTVTDVNRAVDVKQYVVAWDNGRRLMLLHHDPFIILPSQDAPIEAGRE
jgi:hypothetical protein